MPLCEASINQALCHWQRNSCPRDSFLVLLRSFSLSRDAECSKVGLFPEAPGISAELKPRGPRSCPLSTAPTQDLPGAANPGASHLGRLSLLPAQFLTPPCVQFCNSTLYLCKKKLHVLKKNASQPLKFHLQAREASREALSPPAGTWLSLPAAQRDSRGQEDGPCVRSIIRPQAPIRPASAVSAASLCLLPDNRPRSPEN